MPRGKALSLDTLEALGARPLAELLLDHAAADPTLRKKLALALAGHGGADRLVAELDKRLKAIGRARSAIGWERLKPLAQELEHLRATIAGPLAAQDPAVAVSRLWELLGLAEGVIGRSADGGNRAAVPFEQAVQDLGRLLAAMPGNARALAGRVWAFLEEDRSGLGADLLPALGEALGGEGRAAIRRHAEAALAALPPAAERTSWRAAQQRVRLAFQLGQLADLEQDPDAFAAAMEQGGLAEHRLPEIALRLLDAGRAEDALGRLDRSPEREADPAASPIPDLRLKALDTLGRKADAQAARWQAFARWLSLPHLKEHLRRLPDFEDAAAERQALALALDHPERNRALALLVAWGRLEAADRLARAEIAALNPRDHATLRAAAEALAERYPQAATLLYRRLVQDVLDRGASAHYEDAAHDAAALARLPELAGMEDHAAFMAELRRRYGRKYTFWQRLDSS